MANKTRRKIIRWTVLIILTAALLVSAAWAAWRYHGPAPETEIYRGITYGCERLPETDESGGLLHYVRADLNVPGVSLYVTPLDADAKSQGWEYKLRYVSTAVSEDHLAAAVNGTLYASNSIFVRLPGDLATSNETVVADHVVNHIHPHTYLFWWDEQWVAHLESNKPPSAPVLARARWAIGGQEPVLIPGHISGATGADARTFIAADPEKKLVWIACFDKASFRFAAKILAEHDAKIATALDGGTSTTLAIGSEAKNVRTGTIRGNWRPVATQFGFRASALP